MTPLHKIKKHRCDPHISSKIVHKNSDLNTVHIFNHASASLDNKTVFIDQFFSAIIEK